MKCLTRILVVAGLVLLAAGCAKEKKKKKKQAPTDCDQSAECEESGKCYPERRKCGFGSDLVIEDPPGGSPHQVVQRALRAAAIEPYNAAFNDYSNLLHSSETDSVLAMKEWETLRFPAMRRKHKCFVRGQASSGPAYELVEVREQESLLKLFVACSTSDLPTPCHLKRDPKAGGAWRIVYSCLN